MRSPALLAHPSLHRQRLRCPSALFALIATSFLCACPPSGSGGDPDGGAQADGGAGGGGTDPCPAGNGDGLSVCQVQNPASPGYPGEGATVTVRGVVALSDVFDVNSAGTIQAVFVSDVPMAPYSGVLVTFLAEQNVTVTVGQLLDVTGTVQEFSSGAVGSETRIQATTVQATGGNADVTPIDVADPATLADEITGEAYEGVLVRVRSVEVTNPDLGFGQFEVSGGLVVDDNIYRYAALDGEVFGSLTGVLGYNAFENGGFRLLPRSADDVESTSRPSVTLRQLRDSTAEGYIEPCPFCPGEDSSCTAARVSLSNLVVVSETYFIGRNATGPLFGFFLADPSLVDGEGRMTAYSGILATIRPDSTFVAENSYSFEQDEEFNFVGTDAAPAIGDVVSVVGENGGFCGMAQLANLTDLVKMGAAGQAGMPALPLPARFDGAVANANDPRHPSRLMGGRPEVTVAQGGVERAAVAPDAAVESWEGVLVELVNVDTEEACIGYPYSSAANNVPAYMRDFGYWSVTGGAEIGTLFDNTFGGFWLNVPFDSTDRTCSNTANKCEDSRSAGQTFTSLTGIVNYAFNVYRVNPRSTDDIQPSSLFVADGTGNCTAP